MKILVYQTPAGKLPFSDWFQNLQKSNKKAAQKIFDKINRALVGHPADMKALQGHRPLLELRVDAYRVYCVIEGETLMILLCAGDKGSQKKEFRQAAKYWDEYRSRRGMD